jgi:hypothetical protein
MIDAYIKLLRLLVLSALDAPEPQPTTTWLVARVFGAQVIEFWLFFAVTSVANCMTVQHRA